MTPLILAGPGAPPTGSASTTATTGTAVLLLADRDTDRSTEVLGDREALRRSLVEAWSYGLTTGFIRPVAVRGA